MRPPLSHLTSANSALERHVRWTLASAGAIAVIAAVALLPAMVSAGQTAAAGGPTADCQPFLDVRPCLQPFPSNLYTKKANTPTGR